MTRAEAFGLLTEFTKSDSLIKHVEKGAELLGLPLDQHITNVITAMQTVAGPLGFG